MYRALGRIIFLLVLLSAALRVAAQDLHCVRIGKEQGLPNEEVYDVFQDSKGFIWVTHEEGLCRYDGYEFRAYTCAGQTAQAGANLQEDKFGRIWYQNFDGFLYYVEGDSLRALEQRATVGYRRTGIGGGKLFAVQQEGVDVFDLKTLRFMRTLPFEMPSHIVYSELIGQNFYILNNQAIFALDVETEKWSYVAHPPEAKNQRPDLMKQGSNGSIMLFPVLSEGRWAFALEGESYRIKYALPIKAFIQNVCYMGGFYWFCTADGVYVCDDVGNFLEDGKNLLQGHNITSVHQDREGNFWFGTKDAGLLMMPDIRVRVLFRDISAVSLFPLDSLLYLGGAVDDLYAVDLRRSASKKIYQGDTRHELTVLGYDSIAGHLLVQSKNFMHINCSGEVLQRWTAAVKGLVRISRKYTAIALSGVFGLQKHEGESGADIWDAWHERYHYESPLITAGLFQGVKARAVVYLRGSESLYFATSYGLWLLQPDTMQEIFLAGERIYLRELCEMGGFVYGYTPQGEVYKIDSLHRVSIVRLPTPPLQRIQRIKKQGGWLFVQSGGELYYAEGSSDDFRKLYTYSNRIKDFVLVGERLILATPKGLLLQNFAQGAPPSVLPIFRINALRVNNVEQPQNALPLILEHWQNDVEIQYSILSFKTGGAIPLFYRINEGEWEKAPDDSRILRLAALSSGEYCIQFRLGSLANDSSLSSESVCFRIRPAWWQTWWFWIGIGLLLVGLAYIYYRQQTQALKQQNTLLSEKIELEQNLNRSTLKAIKSQMNPHFFYNALNTLQAYIFSGDKRNALRHITNFSRLTRMVLDMSEADSISLEDEIRSLSLYLELEKVRFNDLEFQYEIRTEEDIQPAALFIPPMLIQPYVENAIKHGLLHKEGGKRLFVGFSVENAFLCVQISDNGVGRERSAEINKNREKHRSFATQANQTRLQLISQYTHTKAAIHFVDKRDENTGAAAGTDVFLKIPLS